jgi:hypothetical protein
MKKLSLRTEHLGALSAEDLSMVAGAGELRLPDTNVSDGSCVCTLRVPGIHVDALRVDVSDGSCVCFC